MYFQVENIKNEKDKFMANISGNIVLGNKLVKKVGEIRKEKSEEAFQQ